MFSSSLNVRYGLCIVALIYFATSTGAVASVLPVNGIAHGHGSPDEVFQLYTVEVPAAGVLSLEVTVPGDAEVVPRIGIRGRQGSAPKKGLLLLEERPTRLTAVVRMAGTYRLHVAAQDPRLRLGAYRLTSMFALFDAADHVVPTEGAGTGEDPDEIETEPDDGSGFSTACRSTRRDPHSDTLTCASWIESPEATVAGRISSATAQDMDVFKFRLEELATIRLMTSGSVDSLGVLFDRDGNRLAVDDDSGRDGHFRIVRTLGPGLYFLRVESRHGGQGAYRLHFKTLSR